MKPTPLVFGKLKELILKLSDLLFHTAEHGMGISKPFRTYSFDFFGFMKFIYLQKSDRLGMLPSRFYPFSFDCKPAIISNAFSKVIFKAGSAIVHHRCPHSNRESARYEFESYASTDIEGKLYNSVDNVFTNLRRKILRSLERVSQYVVFSVEFRRMEAPSC